MKILSIAIASIFLLTSCFKKEEAPQAWTDWTKKAQDRYQEKISIPSAIQHLYVPLAEGRFYLTQSEDKYKLEKVSSFDSDQEFTVDYNKEEILKDGKVFLTKEKPVAINDRISLSVAFYKDETSHRARVFLYDLGVEDLDKKRQRHFYHYSSNYIKTAQYKKLDKPETKKFGRSDGTTRDFNKLGELIFDENNSLSLYAEPESTEKKVMLMFKDATSGSSTYGAGRYVVIDLPSEPSKLENDSEIKVDFNYTFNPPCAVSKGFHCPLAQDILSMKVKAGEKYKL